ncbi:MAG: exopolysaccharide biosynthesis polyprenyl glycosylphosphotransferase [Pseudomonadota bacterium]
MSTGLLQDVERRVLPTQKRPVTHTNAFGTPANDTVDVTSAQLPSRRIRLSRASLRTLLKFVDWVIAAAIVAGFLIISGTGILSATVSQILPFAMIPAVAIWGLHLSSAYRLLQKRRMIDHILATAYGSCLPLVGFGFLVQSVYPAEAAHWVMPALFTTWLTLNFVHAMVLIIGRQCVRAGWLSENVVIVGATPNARRLIERNGMTRELNIVGIFDDRLSRAPKQLNGAPLLGRLDDLFAWDRLPEIDRVVVTVTSDARDRVRDMVERLRVLPQRVVLLLDLDGFDPETESLAEIAHSPAAYVSGQPHDARRAMSKRIFDLMIATSMLVLLSPLLVALALAIKLESPGPAIFRQKRHGFNNQIIKVWKFRSMRDDPNAAERMTHQTIANDPRITRIGRLIRQTSIDELPQLINVIRGEMSIVGPRPHAVGMTTEEQEVQNIVGEYAHRHRAKPGITGWAQINGSRGPVHTKALVRERVRLDMEYVNRSALWFDLYIILMTLPRLLGDAKTIR